MTENENYELLCYFAEHDNSKGPKTLSMQHVCKEMHQFFEPKDIDDKGE